MAGVTFMEGDDYHSRENVAKMATGAGLTNEDRRPWVQAIGAAWAESGQRAAVLACSALNAEVRQMLASEFGSAMRPVLLDVPEGELLRRLEAREGHFAGPEFLAGQMAAMDDWQGVERLDGAGAPEALAEAVATLFEG